MNEGYNLKKIGTSRVVDILTSMNNGYMYDLPTVRHTLKDYTTFSNTPMILNISNKKLSHF